MIENEEKNKKLDDREDFSYFYLYLVGNEKKERMEK